MWHAAPPSPAKTHGPANANTNVSLFHLGRRNPLGSPAALTHHPTTPRPTRPPSLSALDHQQWVKISGPFPSRQRKSPPIVKGKKVTGTTGRDSVAVTGAPTHSTSPQQDWKLNVLKYIYIYIIFICIYIYNIQRERDIYLYIYR